MVAFLIDWNISFLPFVLIILLLVTIISSNKIDNDLIAMIMAIFCILSVFSALAMFILRDVIFKGKSIGKRAMGLCVYDKKTLQKATVKQRFLRNIFLCIYLIDFVVLLVAGETIGDMVAGTVVLSEKSIDDYRNKQIDDGAAYVHNPQTNKKKSYKKIVIIVAVGLCCLIAFVGLVQAILNSQKGTVQYEIAYDYFVSSEAFKQLNVDESKIRMNSWSSHTYFTEDQEGATSTVEIGFMVGNKSFTVVCHQIDGVWQICDNCTLF